jgi:hypothetical protein
LSGHPDLLDVLLIFALAQAPELSQRGISLGLGDEPVVSLQDIEPLIGCADPVLVILISPNLITHIDSPFAEADSSVLSKTFPTGRWSSASQAVLRPDD